MATQQTASHLRLQFNVLQDALWHLQVSEVERVEDFDQAIRRAVKEHMNKRRTALELYFEGLKTFEWIKNASEEVLSRQDFDEDQKAQIRSLASRANQILIEKRQDESPKREIEDALKLLEEWEKDPSKFYSKS